ncbi:hypothetical protein [Streptomyces sp. enrichment culture]|uniref:hypothetical protein n=1 Tax=Streptomyces sp. enrichment culture TaxID=1795815 RepID=UPI003F554E43
MCRIDATARNTAVARFLQEFPAMAEAGREHPALRGCDSVAWPELPGCPAGIPALLRGLLDRTTAAEAERVLHTVLMDGVFSMGPAMPAALPYLIRLTADPEVPVRSGLMELLLVVAELSHPVDEGGERAVRLFGSDRDHPERARCRAVFADHADLLRALLDEGSLLAEPLRPDERESLLRAAAG